MWEVEKGELKLRAEELKIEMNRAKRIVEMGTVLKEEAEQEALTHVREFSENSIEKVGRIWDCFSTYQKESEEDSFYKCFYTELNSNYNSTIL